jgi:hypothetical protein
VTAACHLACTAATGNIAAMHLSPTTLNRAEWSLRLLAPPLLAGVALGGVYLSAMFEEPPGWSLTVLLVVIAQVYIIGEGVRLISRWLQGRLPWRERLGRRVLVQVLASLGFACIYLLLIYVPIKLREIAQGSNDHLGWPHLAFTLLFAFALGLALSLLQLIFDLLQQWQRSELEAERLRRSALRMELDALKAQLNPHFLFNSLNTLHGLIDEAPERARLLVLELSDVLRYVLRHGEQDLVPLSEELDFLQAYLRILDARHGDGLRLIIGDLGDTATACLPPMSLQVLIENVVRHNRIDPGQSLSVSLTRAGDRLQMRNPLRPMRSPNAGAGIGLKNLQARYQALQQPPPEVSRDAADFCVSLPLAPCRS